MTETLLMEELVLVSESDVAFFEDEIDLLQWAEWLDIVAGEYEVFTPDGGPVEFVIDYGDRKHSVCRWRAPAISLRKPETWDEKKVAQHFRARLRAFLTVARREVAEGSSTEELVAACRAWFHGE